MNKPNIHLYTLCYNEERLIPYFYRHYSRFVDKITVFDNHSTDSSVDILKKYKKVDVCMYDTKDEINDQIWLDMKNNCWKKSRGKFDFVIVCDIDELLYHPKINDLLCHIKNKNYTIVKPNGYHMISNKFPSCANNIYDEVKYGNRSEDFDKMILFDPNKIEEISYDYGCHEASPTGNIKMYKDDKDLKLLHFKDLSIDYLLKKYERNKKRLSEFNKKTKYSHHYALGEKFWRNYFSNAYKNKIKVV